MAAIRTPSMEEIRRLKNNKSPGTVNIPTELQKHGGGKLEQ
jgi:hypothetical protein